MKLPKHLRRYYGDGKSFQQSKRRELRDVFSCFDDLLSGSACSPALKEIKQVCRLLRIIKEKQSVKNWK